MTPNLPPDDAVAAGGVPWMPPVLLLPELLDRLGWRTGECVQFGFAPPGGDFKCGVVRFEPGAIGDLPQDRDIWFGVNPVGPSYSGGRPRENDVTRWVALWCDLDVKLRAFPDLKTAEAVVTELAAKLGQEPVAVTMTGHGEQPLWALEGTDELTVEDRRALLRRWGRAVRVIADRFKAEVDSVWDAPRLLRSPGTVNHKEPTKPVKVRCLDRPGGPVEVGRLVEVLEELNIVERPEDREAIGDVVSTPDTWVFVDVTDNYASAMITGWVTDMPTARHPWLVSQATRLAAAHRLGCITEADYRLAADLIASRFRELLVTGTPPRRETAGEVIGAFAWGVDKVATFTDERAREELGGHAHRSESTAAGASGGGSSTSSAGAAAKEMKVRVMGEMTVPDAPLWVAVGYLPQALTVLTGDEGIGKSLWWVRVAARITTGRADPTIGLPAGHPRDVIIVVTEDAWGEVHARLLLAGADPQHIHLVCEADDGSGVPEFPPQIGLLDEAAGRLDLALVVVDAWIDTAPSNTRVKEAKQTRDLLLPWRDFTVRHACCVLLLVNTNRLTGVSLRDRVGISAELRKKARILLHGEAPPDKQDVLYVGPDKVNGIVRADAVRYRIHREQVRPRTDHDPGTVARLADARSTGEPISKHVAEWEAAQKAAERPLSADERIDQWLPIFMQANSGKVLAETGKVAAHRANHSPERVVRRLKALGGESRPVVKHGPFWWLLPPRGQDSDVGARMSEDPKSSETSESCGSDDGLWDGKTSKI